MAVCLPTHGNSYVHEPWFATWLAAATAESL